MASVVIASRNESSWGQSVGLFMGKIHSSNPHLNPNPNSKPNPKKKQKYYTVNGRQADDSPVVTQTASDDAHSFNQRSVDFNSRNGFNHGAYISLNISSCSRSELKNLRKRLVAELKLIRNLNERIVSGQFQPTSHANPQIQGKIKKLSGNKRPHPFVSGKDSKRLCQTSENGNWNSNGNADLMKMCRQVLTKLMKHKVSWIFNKPVDAVAMGLHDYHQIVKQPMDLGTVKSNLVKNIYDSPADFSADVRLTFENAMLYNPKGDEVYSMAEQLLVRFEEMFRPMEVKLGGDRKESGPVGDELQGSSWSHLPTPERVKKPKPSLSNPMPRVSKKQDRMQTLSSASTPSNTTPANPPSVQSPVPTSSPTRALAVKPSAARGVGKQPKPRAKDPKKREMSMEEKQKLGIGLQSLPQEKMPQLVQIVRKRNEHLGQEGDEIELDIEALDTETLWELDRFVTNWKKLVSKTKRQALMVNNFAVATSTAEADGLHVSEKTDAAKKPKKGETGDEDVDIGDDMPASSFPPVEIEKDDGVHVPGNASSSSGSSSSSSSGSSSSSDSDSGSSSGSDSDADDAHS